MTTTPDIKNAIQAIRVAKDLKTLCAKLNEAKLSLAGSEFRLEELIDLTELQKFGGDMPPKTTDIYSWDPEASLIYLGFGIWALQSRIQYGLELGDLDPAHLKERPLPEDFF